MPTKASTTSKQGAPIPRGVGRPRSQATRSQILSTTIRLLETQSVQTITIEAIAREAGVGKATIYRWWASKALVVIDAFMDHYVVKTPMDRDLPPGDAIAQHIRSIVHEYSGWSGRLVAQILAEGQSDPDVLREFRQRFHYGRRAVVREMLEAWRQSAGIPTPPNIELLGDFLYAPIYMRLMFGHAPLDENFANEHIAYVFSLLGVKPPSPPTKPAAKAARRVHGAASPALS